MGKNEEIASAVSELSAIAAQKKEVIESFGKKYAILDTDYKALCEKERVLQASVKALENVKEEAKAIIEKANKAAIEVVNAAHADAAEIVSAASVKAGKVVADAEDALKGARNEYKRNNEIILSASRRIQEAEDITRKSDASRMAAEVVISESVKEKEAAINAQVKAEAKLAELAVKLRALEAFEAELKMREDSVSGAEIDIGAKRADVDSRLSAVLVLESEIKSKKQKADDDIARDMAMIDKARAEIKTHAENNAWRTRELDIGFEIIENKKLALDKDIKKLEMLKKELSK